MTAAARLFLAALCVALLGGRAAAETVQDGQLWFNTTLFGSVGDVAYFAEIQPRFGNDISHLDQLLLRPAVGWKIDDNLTLYQGYARVLNRSEDSGTAFEDRSFQEVNWKIGEFAGVKLSSRTRFEQRWQSTGRDVGFRLRESLRVAKPLGEAKDSLSVIGSSETFVTLNDTDWGSRAGFDRIRTFIGLEIPIGGQSGDKSTVEIGYLNQTARAPGRGVEVDHILSLNLFIRP